MLCVENKMTQNNNGLVWTIDLSEFVLKWRDAPDIGEREKRDGGLDGSTAHG